MLPTRRRVFIWWHAASAKIGLDGVGIFATKLLIGSRSDPILEQILAMLQAQSQLCSFVLQLSIAQGLMQFIHC